MKIKVDLVSSGNLRKEIRDTITALPLMARAECEAAAPINYKARRPAISAAKVMTNAAA